MQEYHGKEAKTFYGYFKNAFKTMEPTVYADRKDAPRAAAFRLSEAMFLSGNPAALSKGEQSDLMSKIYDYDWMLIDREEWATLMAERFGDKLETHIRTEFRTDTLNEDFIGKLRKPLPANLRLERVSAKLLEEPENPVDHWVISRTFNRLLKKLVAFPTASNIPRI